MVDAHDQNVTHHYTMHYPEHPPRKKDPHYKDFEAFKRKYKKTAVCAKGKDKGDFSECGGGLELHHAHVEFALTNAIDLAALEAHYPGISDPSKVGAWVESGENFEWLCILPNSPVLMADGSSRPIEFVQPGEWVITHDGTPGIVSATTRKRYRGEVARLGPAALTLSHRVLTSRGWLSVAQILREVGMHGPNMILLRGEQHQIVGSVVGSVAVEMVDTFAGPQRSPDHALHNVTMFHDPSGLSIAPNDHPNITLGRNVAPAPIGLCSHLTVQPDDPTFIGAVEIGSRTPMRRPVKLGTADGAATQMRWVAPMLTAGLYSGWVHDLTVHHNHSFIAGGIAVHNCAFHHRGHGGVHVASASDYEAETFVKGLIS